MSSIPPVILSALAQTYYAIESGIQNGQLTPNGANQPYRPPQWSSPNDPARLTMTFTDPITRGITAYVFDAVIRSEHDQQSVITQNPVQTGPAISDHAYVVPARLTIELLMTDAMQSFTLGQWSDGPSRSVSAFQTLKSLQQKKAVLQVATRLNTYSPMMILSVRAEEQNDTRFSLKATVSFMEILTASVEMTSSTINFAPSDSSLPQTVGQTVGGQLLPLTVPGNVQLQDNIQNAAAAGINLAPVPMVAGAGNWTSTGLGSLASMVSGLG
jgi:hypothetical protein